MPDVTVVKLRLKRAVLREFKELTKGQPFTVAEAMRAAMKIGLEAVKVKKDRVKLIEDGVISPASVLVPPKSDKPSSSTTHQQPVSNQPGQLDWDHDSAMVEWISGTGQAHPLKQMERAKTVDQLRETVAWMEARLKEIDAAWFSIPVHDESGAEVEQELPFDVFRKVKALADEKGITDEAAFNILLEEYQSNPEPGGQPIKVRFIGPKATKRAKSPKASSAPPSAKPPKPKA